MCNINEFTCLLSQLHRTWVLLDMFDFRKTAGTLLSVAKVIKIYNSNIYKTTKSHSKITNSNQGHGVYFTIEDKRTSFWITGLMIKPGTLSLYENFLNFCTVPYIREDASKVLSFDVNHIEGPSFHWKKNIVVQQYSVALYIFPIFTKK